MDTNRRGFLAGCGAAALGLAGVKSAGAVEPDYMELGKPFRIGDNAHKCDHCDRACNLAIIDTIEGPPEGQWKSTRTLGKARFYCDSHSNLAVRRHFRLDGIVEHYGAVRETLIARSYRHRLADGRRGWKTAIFRACYLDGRQLLRGPGLLCLCCGDFVSSDFLPTLNMGYALKP